MWLSEINERYNCTISRAFDISTGIICLFEALVAMFGNILILVSLVKYRHIFKGNLYMFIGNLAVADLLLVLGMYFLFPRVILDESFQGKFYICLIGICCCNTSLKCSSLTLTLMAVDRCVAICCPLRHKVILRQGHMCFTAILLTWLLSICFGTIPVICNVDLTNGENVCRYGYVVPYWQTFTTSIMLSVEIVVNHIASLSLLYIARRRQRMVPNIRRSTKTLLMVRIYLTFGLCWLPYVILTFIIAANPYTNKYVCYHEFTLAGGVLNSALNWVIYGAANEKFQKTFKDILTKVIGLRRNQHGLSNISIGSQTY